MTAVRLKRADYDAIVARARSCLPNEACGLIAGTAEGGVKTVGKIYLMSNTDESPERFSISPEEQLAAVKDMRADGLAPLGNFHSHPSTPARPSEEDMKMYRDSGASYLILSLAETGPVLKAFGVKDGEAVPQTLEIV